VDSQSEKYFCCENIPLGKKCKYLPWSIGKAQPVERHDCSTTESNVVLECKSGTGNLPFVGHASQLPAQFCALSQAWKWREM